MATTECQAGGLAAGELQAASGQADLALATAGTAVTTHVTLLRVRGLGSTASGNSPHRVNVFVETAMQSWTHMHSNRAALNPINEIRHR